MDKEKEPQMNEAQREITLPVLPKGQDVIYTEDQKLVSQALDQGYCAALAYAQKSIRLFVLFKMQ